MKEQISTIFNKKEIVNSDAEAFYNDYWTIGTEITESTINKNKKILSAFFPKGIINKRILEVGVGGEGGIIFPLKNFNTVAGADISDSAIFNCSKMELKIDKINLDQDNLPYDNNSFDIIFALEVFEHFSNPQHALEEIIRVLTDEGLLIISIPTPLTYHWPRLFYPSLFEFQNFKEFLMINGFNAEYFDLKIFKNIHHEKNIEQSKKMLSWFWRCRKIKPDDHDTFLNIAEHFWEQKDENNLRIKTVEAVEMFRKSYNCSPDNVKTKLKFIKALLYRFIMDDKEEFNSIFHTLDQDINQPSFQNDPESLYELLLFDLETKSIGSGGFDRNFIEAVKSLLINHPDGKSYIENISNEKRKLNYVQD